MQGRVGTFDQLPHAHQVDLLAYWKLLQSHHEGKRLLMRSPASFLDVFRLYGLSRGVPLNPANAPTVRGKRGNGVRVQVYNNGVIDNTKLTPQIQKAAEQFRDSNIKGDWAKKTGSNPDAIAWWTS